MVKVLIFFNFQARDLANPRPKSLFIQRLHDKKEDLYASKKKAPLGNYTAR